MAGSTKFTAKEGGKSIPPERGRPSDPALWLNSHPICLNGQEFMAAT